MRSRSNFASGQASAYYQVPGDSANLTKPGINYVTGRIIRLVFKEKEVETVTVTDQVSGVYLAPLPADSATRQPPGTRPPDPATTRPPRPPRQALMGRRP